MIKSQIVTALMIFFASHAAYCQEVLDVEKQKDAEIFVAKKGYDVGQRLQEIDAIAGKKVTVYELSGKQNKIKLTYTGVAEAARVPKFSDKQKASLITVRTKSEGGVMRAYYPLTNDSRYRIYLTEKMKQN